MIILVAMLLGAFGAWFMARYAFALGVIDEPSIRSSHVSPTPRGGGLGILAAFVAAALSLRAEWALWLPATVLAVMSLFDDRLDLSARFRLLAQFSAAVVPVVLLCQIEGPWSLLFVFSGVLYIVSTTNFFNFMDGINGVAGITATVAFGLFSWFSWSHDLGDVPVFLSLSMASACLGFLPFNFPSAKVFMGDVGSILLGFVFAVLVMVYSESFAVFLCLSGFLFLFYADTLTTLFIRWRTKEQLSKAHRRHLYQILVNEMKMEHWKVSVAYGAAQLFIGWAMAMAWRANVYVQILLWLTLAIIFIFVSWSVRRKNVSMSEI